MNRFLSTVRKRSDIGAVLGTVLIFAVFTTIDFHGWWNPFTLKNVLQYTAILGIVAVGQAFVIISGEIDLSVGSVYGLTSVAFIIFEGNIGVPLAFLAAMLISALIGFLNGYLVARLRLASMIITLSGLFVYRGVIYVWTGGTTNSLSQDGRVHWLTELFGENWLGLENAMIWLIVILVLTEIVLHKMPYGNQLLAVGGDETSAHSRGVDIIRTKITAFVCSSMLAGFSGIVTICDEPRTHVSLGQELELEAIAATIVGGCLLSGGHGSFLGVALGAFIITSVRYELIGLGAPASWFISFVGILLIVAVIVNRLISDRLAS